MFESDCGIVNIPNVKFCLSQLFQAICRITAFNIQGKRRETTGEIEGQSSFIHHSVQYTYGSRMHVYLQCFANSIQPLQAGFLSNRIRMCLRLFTQP